MARFMGGVQGSRGEATRLGSSDIRGWVNGWNLGLRITGRKVYESDREDEFYCSITGGSNGGRLDRHIFTVSEPATVNEDRNERHNTTHTVRFPAEVAAAIRGAQLQEDGSVEITL